MTRKLHPDTLISELAAGQHGVVARSQLALAGVSKRIIDRRIADGRLKPVYRGVYRVGPVMAERAREMAAVLACGVGAVVSLASAGTLWKYLPPRVAEDPVDITVTRDARHRLPGIRARRARSLRPEEVGLLDGIPLTSPERTLLDLAGVLDPNELERAVALGERNGVVNLSVLASLLVIHPRHPGAGTLRALLQADAPPALTRSEAELRMLQLVRRSRMKPPTVNARLHGYEVDFLWPTERLIVEVDGYAFHSSARSFMSDRRRDATLTAAGYRVVRVTWADIVETPEATVFKLAQAFTR